MLSSIKDKLLSVKKNVALFNTPDKECESSPSIDLNAGSNLLAHYQTQWRTLHIANEENARKADEAATLIGTISQKIVKDKRNFTYMTHLLTQTNMVTTLSQCSKQIDKLYDNFEDLERQLVNLDNLIEQTKFDAMKKQHEHHLQQYKVRKNESLDAFEASLKSRYEKNAAQYESKRKQELEERQQVFQEAFKNDLEVFKNLGTIPKLDLPPKKSPSALLEEIQFDYDENELNKFFEDQNTSK